MKHSARTLTIVAVILAMTAISSHGDDTLMPPSDRSSLTNQASQSSQPRHFQGKVVSSQKEKVNGTDIALRVRTDQGLMPVEAGAQWDQQKDQLSLNNGDDVEITGFVTGFGDQRGIVAQQITAHGKTVRLETTGRPYRETGRELPGIDEGARQSTQTNNPPNETPQP